MLLVDPLKRITIPEIRQHPWFTVHLPRYLAGMQADPVGAGAVVDEEIMREVVRLGFTREFVAESLQSRVQNKVGGAGRAGGGAGGCGAEVRGRGSEREALALRTASLAAWESELGPARLAAWACLSNIAQPPTRPAPRPRPSR